MFGKKHEANQNKAWKKLTKHYHEMQDVEMRGLFRKDPQRAERYNINIESMMLDYSKNRITDKTMTYLLDLAKEAKLSEKIEAMFRGDKILLTSSILCLLCVAKIMVFVII